MPEGPEIRRAADELAAALVEFRRLQPPGAVAPYEQGREGFVVPPDWSLAGPR